MFILTVNNDWEESRDDGEGGSRGPDYSVLSRLWKRSIGSKFVCLNGPDTADVRVTLAKTGLS